MADIKAGDRVRIKDRKDWPTPPGYAFANAEGTVVTWSEYEGVMDEFQDYVHIKIEKAYVAAKVYIDSVFPFQVDTLEKI